MISEIFYELAVYLHDVLHPGLNPIRNSWAIISHGWQSLPEGEKPGSSEARMLGSLETITLET